MKKLLLLLFMAMLLFAGCTDKAKAVNPNGSATLTVWCWDPTFNVYAMKVAADIYKRDHPNINIKIEDIGWNEIQQKLITALSSGQTSSLPDIVLIQDNAIQKNISTFPNDFLPLSDKIDLNQFASFKVAFGEYKGKGYSVPFDNGATGTFLRRDIIEQAGLKISDFNDITWERFFELSKIVKATTGVTMMSADMTSPDIPLIMLQSAGTWMFDEQGKPFLKDNLVLKQALQLYVKGIQEGDIILGSDWNSYLATINNSNVASSIQAAWLIGSIVAEKSQSGKWAVTNTPKFSNINSVNYSSNGGSSWVVTKASKNPDLAIDFLNKTFAGSVELYETILPSSGAIGTWLPAGNSPVYTEPQPFFGDQKIYEDFVNYASKVPQVKYGVFNYEARDALTRSLPALIAGTITVDSALETAQKELEFIVTSAQ